MFEKLKEYGIYIFLGVLGIGILGYMYIGVLNNKIGQNIDEQIVDRVLKGGVLNQKSKESILLGSHILKGFNNDSLGNKKLNNDEIIYTIGETYDDVLKNQKTIELNGLNNVRDGEIKLVLFSGKKLGIEGKLDVSELVMTKDNELIIGNEKVDSDNINSVNNDLKGYSISGVGIGPFEKNEANVFRNKYFPTKEVYQIGDTDKYLILGELGSRRSFDGKKLVSFRRAGGNVPTTSIPSPGNKPKPIQPENNFEYTIQGNETTTNGNDTYTMLEGVGTIIYSNKSPSSLNNQNGKFEIQNGTVLGNVSFSIGTDGTVTKNGTRTGMQCEEGYQSNEDLTNPECSEVSYIVQQTENVNGTDYQMTTGVGEKITPKTGPKTFISEEQIQNGKKIHSIEFSVTLTNNVKKVGKRLTGTQIICDEHFKENNGLCIPKKYSYTIKNREDIEIDETSNFGYGHSGIINFEVLPKDDSNTGAGTVVRSGEGETIVFRAYGRQPGWHYKVRTYLGFTVNSTGTVTKKILDGKELICDPGYEINENYNSCIKICKPLKLHDFNNTTVIANKQCATPGKTYQLDGNTYYVVRDKSDLINKLFTNTQYEPNRLVTTYVTDFSGLFSDHLEFNKDISNWDTSNVTNMKTMFSGNPMKTNGTGDRECYVNGKLNFNIQKGTPLFNHCFRLFHKFNGDISLWNTSKVTNMKGMFYKSLFNQHIGNWNVSNVKNTEYMFHMSFEFNQNLERWDLDNLVSAEGMFFSAHKFNNKGKQFMFSEFTNLENGKNMFTSSKFNSPVNNFRFSKLKKAEGMFDNDYFKQDISMLDFSKVEDGSPIGDQSTIERKRYDVRKFVNLCFNKTIFNNLKGVCGGLESEDGKVVLTGEGTFVLKEAHNGNGGPGLPGGSGYDDMNGPSYMNETVNFYGKNLIVMNNKRDLSMMLHNISSGYSFGREEVDSLITSKITDFSGLFENQEVPKGIGTWDVSNGTDFSNMFKGANLSEGIDFSGWRIDKSGYTGQNGSPIHFGGGYGGYGGFQSKNFNNMFQGTQGMTDAIKQTFRGSGPQYGTFCGDYDFENQHGYGQQLCQ